MEEYKNCPRCNSEWSTAKDKHYTECSNESCHMRYAGNLVMPHFLGVNGTHLVWMAPESEETRHCLYNSLSEIVTNKAIKLPWLPFDVTQDQVRELISK